MKIMKYIFFESAFTSENDLTAIKLIRQNFSKRGKINDFVFVNIKSEEEAENVIRNFIRIYDKNAIYFICGTDLLTSIAVNIFAFTEMILGIIPLGENSLAKCIFDENTDTFSACSSLGFFSPDGIKLKIRKIDVGSVNDFLFVNSVSMGFYAKKKEIAAHHPFLSGLEHPLSLVKSNVKFKGIFNMVSLANSHERHFISEKEILASVFSITNSGYSEEGKLSFDSSVTDKILEANMIMPCNFASLSYNLEMYKRGVTYDSKQGRSFKIDGAEITSSDNMPITFLADGKLFQSENLNIKIHGKALKICYPLKYDTEKKL